MYDKSAGWYDAFYRDKDYEGEARRIAELVRQRHPAAMTLLDVACGTGRHLEYLARTFRCTGVDLEAKMLSVALLRVPEVSLVVGDMTALDLGGQFDTVVCLFSSIGYVRTLDGLQRALAAMARQLAPGGVLVIEPWIRPETWRGGAVVVEVIDEGAGKLVRVLVSRLEETVSVLDIHYVFASPGHVTTADEQHHLGLFTKDQYVAAAETSGLTVEWNPDGLIGRGMVIGVKSPKDG